MVCANTTNSGIVIMDKSVVTVTTFTDNCASSPDLCANIVEIAAVGAHAAIVQATSGMPVTPQTFINKSKSAGAANSLKITGK